MEKLFNKRITERLRENKGITLIALIITIIILIILTAVTINNVIGTDLIGFATKAVENYTDAARDEADKVDKLAGTLDNQGVGEDSIVRAGQIVEKTEKDNYTDADGRKATIPEGFKVSTKSSEQYIKDGLVIQDNEGNEFVWVPCYYGETKPNGTAEDVQEYKKHEYIENDTWKKDNAANYTDWKDEATENEESYGNKSVKEYGGFYIGRYEAGWDETDTSTFDGDAHDYITSDESERKKKNITGKKPISKANVFAWNFISQPNALKVADNMYKDSKDSKNNNVGVTSHLVDGTAWDTITNWIATDGENIVTDSTPYGNYLNNNSNYTGWHAVHLWAWRVSDNDDESLGFTLYANKFKNGSITFLAKLLSNSELNTMKDDYANWQSNASECNLETRIEIPTGSFDKFKLKNIYDLAGNMYEWTTEVRNSKETDGPATSGDSSAVIRSGGFSNSGAIFSICVRGIETTSLEFANVSVSFRVVLYIK